MTPPASSASPRSIPARKAALGAVLAMLSVISWSLWLFPGPDPVRSHLAETASPAAPPPGVEAGWWEAVSAQIAADEYRVSPSGGSLQSPNRAQNLRARYRERGIELAPREGDGSAWRFAWEATSFGRPGALEPVGPASPDADGATVSYRRSGFDERYVNSPRGIEQGFTVHAPPPGDGELCLVGRLSGTLHAQETGDGVVDLFTEQGARVLRYAELEVRDAGGETVPARLRLDGMELAILIDDTDAAYPLTVDPLMTSPAWTAESDQADAYFGWSVATAGDVNGDGFSEVIVGAPLYDNGQVDEGGAFLYYGSAGGLSLAADWTAEGNQTNAQCGSAVATAGDVNGDGFCDVVVGASNYNNGQVDEGRAFVYYGSTGGLSLTPDWTVESNQAFAYFGTSVGTAGDVNGDGYSDVIVGAELYDNGQTDEGRAFVYYGSAGGPSLTPDWTAEPNQSTAHFGGSVGTAGDVNGDGYSDVIVGAFWYDNGQTDEGGAFVYYGSAGGPSLTPDWTAEGDQASARFGAAVATAGDVNGDGYSDVIVGAFLYDGGQLDEGGAWVWYGSSTGLSGTGSPANADWSGEADQAGAYFGISVGTAGDVNGDGYADALVGARLYTNGESKEGRAYVFRGSGSGLEVTPGWTAESNQVDALFAHAVATAGDVNGDGYSDVIVGAFGYDNGEINEGRAFVYLGSPSGPASTSGWTAEGDQASALFGNWVASAGDVDGDGYSDVIVGAYTYDNGEYDEGRAFVYLGSATGPGSTAAWTAESNQAGSQFGVRTGSAGDVNGDGYSDVIVGARFYDDGEGDEGGAFVWYGSAAGLGADGTPANADWSAESDQADASLGISVGAGDVNGDGYGDVIVGAWTYDNDSAQLDEGHVFVWYGGSTGLGASGTPSNADWTAESNVSGARLGYVAGSAGDVNGDGYSDVIASALYFADGETDEGAAFVWLGSASGLGDPGTPSNAAWSVQGNEIGALLGASAGTAGDVNGDGFSDVIVGAPLYGSSDGGAAFVYLGSAGGLSASFDWMADCDSSGANFGGGAGVATAGDVNGDGYSDVIVGASKLGGGGQAFVWLGSETGLGAFGTPSNADWSDGLTQVDARFGFVACAGDVNGDGYADVLVGAPFYDGGQTDEGAVFLYYGNGGLGRASLPRQQQPDGVTPLALLGRSDGETGFRIRAALPSIYGRTRMKVESEVKRLGTPFDGQNTLLGSYASTATGGTLGVDQLVTGLIPGTAHHWRVRARYDMVRTPFLPHGPWVRVPVDGWNETDFRTAGSAPVGVAESLPLPSGGLQLLPAGPNPFAGLCEVRLALANPARVALEVFDVRGSRVARLVDGVPYPAGSHRVSWDGRDDAGSPVASGVYFLRARAGSETRTLKSVLLRK